MAKKNVTISDNLPQHLKDALAEGSKRLIDHKRLWETYDRLLCEFYSTQSRGSWPVSYDVGKATDLLLFHHTAHHLSALCDKYSQVQVDRNFHADTSEIADASQALVKHFSFDAERNNEWYAEHIEKMIEFIQAITYSGQKDLITFLYP